MTPGRLPSISASAVSINASASSTASGRLRFESHDALSAAQRTFGERPVRIAERRLIRADHRDHLGAEIGEHAAGERTRADPLELDHLKARKRTDHSCPRRNFTLTLA